MKRVNVYIEDNHYEALRAKAFVERNSMTNLIKNAIEAFLQQLKSSKKAK